MFPLQRRTVIIMQLQRERSPYDLVKDQAELAVEQWKTAHLEAMDALTLNSLYEFGSASFRTVLVLDANTSEADRRASKVRDVALACLRELFTDLLHACETTRVQDYDLAISPRKLVTMLDTIEVIRVGASVAWSPGDLTSAVNALTAGEVLGLDDLRRELQGPST